MKNINRVAILAVAVVVAALLPMKLVWSSDENASVAQVYLEFDPATGQFVSVPVTDANNVDPESIVKKKNDPAAAQQSTQADPQSVAAQVTNQAGSATADAGSAAPVGGGNSSPMLIVSIIAIGLVGGIVMMMRKKSAA